MCLDIVDNKTKVQAHGGLRFTKFDEDIHVIMLQVTPYFLLASREPTYAIGII